MLALLTSLVLVSPPVAWPAELSYRVVEPAGAGPETPVLVAVHGLGDSGAGFAGLPKQMKLPARVVLPDAPMRWGSGFSWYRVRTAESGADVAKSTELLARLIRDVRRRWPRAAKVTVVGFSQGAVLGMSLAAKHPDLVAAVAAISGYLVPADLAVPKAPRGAPKLLLVHGRADGRIPIAEGRHAARVFRERGWAVTVFEHDGGHVVTADVVARVAGFSR